MPRSAARPYYNDGQFERGTLRGPVVESEPFEEAIASWSADTPAGTWIEVRMRASFGRAWTRWYVLGVWAATTETVARHSVRGQADADGDVATDVLRLRTAARAYQLEIALFTVRPPLLPAVRGAAVATSSRSSARQPGSERAAWGRVLDVPMRSQMVYPEGGEAWCSPTSVAMVLAHYGTAVLVPNAAADTYDWVYGGCGNWSFNVAYAARFGFDAYVTRLRSLRDAERWIAAGVPLVASYAWHEGELDGAPLPRTDGHLGVIVGFDERGNPVLNDPAAADDAGVRRVYERRQFERLWLARSNGAVYVIHPPGHPTP